MMRKAYLIFTLFTILNSNLFSQETDCGTNFYFVTEHSVKCEGGLNTLNEYLNSNLTNSIKNSLINNNFINILVSCNGKVKIPESDLTYSTSQIDTIQSLLNKMVWIPGIQASKPVNTIVKLEFTLDNGNLVCKSIISPIEDGDLEEFSSKLENLNNPNNYKLITGTFRDYETKNIIQNVDVNFAIRNGSYPEYYEENGNFSIKVDKEAIVFFEVHHVNYNEFTFELSEPNNYSLELDPKTYTFGPPLNLIERTPDNSGYVSHNGERLNERKWREKGSSDAKFKYGYSNTSFLEYFVNNFNYTKEALQNKYKDTAKIFFTIDTIGNVTNIQVSNNLNYQIDSLIINILESMHQWTPAVQQNENISQDFELDIIFGPNKYWKKKYKN